MKKHKYSLILASKSPRRKEILSWLNIPFDIEQRDIDETILDETLTPSEIVCLLAKRKSNAIFNELKNNKGFGHHFFPFVIGSDTIVTYKDKIYGKPKNKEEAEQTLKELSGKTHEVLTGVHFTFLEKNSESIIKNKSFFQKTLVKFSEISNEQLQLYLESEEPYDKAGSYGIQGAAQVFIKEIEGSFSNVMGLPINEISDEISSSLKQKDFYDLFKK